MLGAIFCYSQNEPIGHWTDYFSYQEGLTVCQGGSNIYCCCSSGVFSYNLSDNSLQRYNKVTGLSDIGCTVARYNTSTNTLVIGYSDGNIDLMTNNQVINIADLKNSSALGSKAINNIYLYNNLAYISCGQGLMIVDLNQAIILEVCNIGPSGSALNIYSSTIYNNDTVFVATEEGVQYAALNSNLSDYRNWHAVPTNILPKGIYNGIITCGSKVYASFSRRLTTDLSVGDTLYSYSSGKWSRNSIDAGTDNIYSLQSNVVNNVPYVVYSGNTQVNVFDTLGHSIYHVYDYGFKKEPAPKDATLDNTMNLWMADANYGLVQCNTSNYASNYFPPGPFSNSMFALAAQGSTLYIAPGGYDGSYNPLSIGGIGVSEYNDNSWTHLIDNAVPDTLLDLCCIAIDPKNSSHAFVGSYGNGIVEFDTSALINVYNTSNTNGMLKNLYDAKHIHTYSLRIGGLGYDSIGNLWASVSNVDTCLAVKKSDGTWQSFNFKGIPNFPGVAKITNLLVTKSGAKWVIFPGDGILAYQDNGSFSNPNYSNSVFITGASGNGALPSLNVYCMAQDLNGAIWVGTDVRVVVFYSPDNVFNGAGGWDAQNVYVQQTGYTQYLMQGQYTTCIAVDGANRKWIGTDGGGAFLMSADGTQQILNFTTSNSPLPSNNILSIAINQVNGEIFFGTDEGLVSYRGDATEGSAAFGNVYAYPDPVPHGYAGPITIKNLVANSDIKIATVSGEIVYHTIALGGQAVWYGNNFNGERVQTGVYLVFCTSPDGSQSVVTKLLLVN